MKVNHYYNIFQACVTYFLVYRVVFLHSSLQNRIRGDLRQSESEEMAV